MKHSKGKKIIDGLTELVDTLERGEPVAEKFSCKTVVLDLQRTPYSPELVKSTRTILRASQAVFAQFLGVSLSTVRSWGQGIYVPKDVACRFMDEIRRDPEYWKKRLRESVTVKAN